MKKTLFMSLAVVTMALLSACGSSTKIITSNVLDMTPEVRTLVAELEVSPEKVTAVFEAEKSYNDEEQLVRNAVYKALKSVQGDVLIGLQYQITVLRDSNGKVTEKRAEVSGYPAYYRNIRPMPNNKYNIKELKNDVPYIITEKDSNGDTKVYQILDGFPSAQPAAEPAKNSQIVLDVDKAQLEEIVLSTSPRIKKNRK